MTVFLPAEYIVGLFPACIVDGCLKDKREYQLQILRLSVISFVEDIVYIMYLMHSKNVVIECWKIDWR